MGLVALGIAAPLAGVLAVFTGSASVGTNSFATASCFPKWWWDTSYLYRRQVTVTTGSAAVASGYSVRATLDHASLVTAGKSLASGNDVRIAKWNSGTCSWTPLDRVLEVASSWNTATTKLWFKLQAAVGANSTDGDYYIYYGNAAAAAPPADPTQVFFFYDAFSGASLGPSWTVVRAPAAGYSVSGGVLNMGMDQNEDIWQTPNVATVFYVANPAGDYEATVKQIGKPTANGQTTGLLAYQDDDNYQSNYHEFITSGCGPCNEVEEYGSEIAVAFTTPSTFVSVNTNPTYLRIAKAGTTFTDSYSTDGGTTFNTITPVTPKALTFSPSRTALTDYNWSNTGAVAVSFDDLRIRNLVSPEPTAPVGSEALKP